MPPNKITWRGTEMSRQEAGQAIRMEVSGLKETIQFFKEAGTAYQVATVRWLTRWSNRILKDSKGRLDFNIGGDTGGRATGLLRRSIIYRIEKDGDRLASVIGSGLNYAKYVEYGTRPHFVPFSIAPSLERWATSHGIDVKGRKGLKVSGKAHPFLHPAFEGLRHEAYADAQKSFKDAFKR